MQKFWKKILFFFIMIVLSISFLEVCSYFFLSYTGLGQQFPIQNSENAAPDTSNIPSPNLLHPYYGYITNPAFLKALRANFPNSPVVKGVADVNKYGFFSARSPFQAKDEARLVVAVLGGSVACYEASQGEATLAVELERIFKKPVVVLNLALFAGKEPQQLFILTDLISQGAHFDLVINLDGFNEIALPEAHGNVLQHIPPFFPQNWKMLAETNYNEAGKKLYAYLLFLQLCNTRVNDFLKHIAFSQTARFLYVLENKLANKLSFTLQQRLKKLQPAATADYQVTTNGRIFLGPWYEQPKDEAVFYDALAAHFFLCSLLLHNLVVSQHGQYFHFLQPNQYSNDKALSDDEQSLAYKTDSMYRHAVEAGYPLLRQYGQKLDALGVNFEDLSRLFADTPGTVYRDDCCHFNQEGVERIARSMARFIEQRAGRGEKPIPLPR